MKKYDYQKAHSIITEKSNEIESASLGMKEDWTCTGEEVFANGKWLIDLASEKLSIAGICGSTWATPVLELDYKDGHSEVIDCYTGESDPEDQTRFQRDFCKRTSLD